jgi:hypothetical protein
LAELFAVQEALIEAVVGEGDRRPNPDEQGR